MGHRTAARRGGITIVLVILVGIVALVGPGPAIATPTEGGPPPTTAEIDAGGIDPHGGISGDFATAARWDTQALTYGFISTTSDLGAAATRAAFRQAFTVWESAAGFTFTEVPDCAASQCTGADIRIRFDDPFTECLAAFLGCAYYPGQGEISGDVFMNDSYTWSDQEGYDPETNTYDLVTVAIHEVGHAIGMRHTDPGGLCPAETTDPVMCAFINRVTRDLHPDDLAGIRSLYLDGPPANDARPAAEVLTGVGGTVVGSLAAATPDPDDPVCDPGGPGSRLGGVHPRDTGCGLGTVWYRFTAPARGRFVVQSTNLGFGYLGVTAFEQVGAEDLVRVRERVLGGPIDRIAFVAEQGRTYDLALWAVLGDAGSYEVTWAHQPGVLPRFTDVSVEHPAFEDIDGAAARGLVHGYADGTFRPSAPVTRQSMAAFLFRASGEPLPTGCTPTFRDVSASHPFFREICWAVRGGVTEGYADGTFRPAAPVTRQAAARLLRRSVGAAPATGCDLPWDVSPSHPFYGDVCWMATNGITTAEEFRPAVAVSRQAAASFLQRLAALP